MPGSVHSHNFEKCVCLAISVSLMEESQLHQALLCAEFKTILIKELRAGGSNSVLRGLFLVASLQSSKWTEFYHVISKLGVHSFSLGWKETYQPQTTFLSYYF